MRPPEFWLAPLFLLCGAPILLWLALAVPIGQSPDEFTQAARIDSVRRGEIVGKRRPRGDFPDVMDAVVMSDPVLLAMGALFPNNATSQSSHVTIAELERLRALRWSPEPAYFSAPNTAVYPPLLYVPAALGMEAAILRGAGPFFSLLAARLANALLYLVFGTMALALARGIQPVLFAVLLLPMSLAMGASTNQDGPIIAAAVLAAALLSRAPGPFGRAYWLGGLLLAAVLMAKPVYLPLAAIMMVAGTVLSQRDMPQRNMPRRLLAMLAVAMPAMLWFVWTRATVAVPFLKGPPYPAGPLWPGQPGQVFATTDAAANLAVLLHQPSLILKLPWNALIMHGQSRMIEMIGVLGLLDVVLPVWMYAVWTMAGIAALLACAVPDCSKTRTHRIAAFVMIMALLASVILVYITQYLSWTLVGAPEIEGVQGRYFIPLLAFSGFAVPRICVPGGQWPRLGLTLPAITASLLGLVAIPGAILFAYYIK